MAFFKTKAEKELIAKMEREEQMQAFQDQIDEMKVKRQEYAKIAAEAELNGDEQSYKIALNAILELNDVISALTQTKANFDIINVSNAVAVNMAMSMNILNKMATGKSKMPNIRKIQKTQLKMSKYMKDVKIAQKGIGYAMKSVNPANKPRTQEDISAVRPFIEAELYKLSPSTLDVEQKITTKDTTNTVD